jgi:hypothetical protein
MAVTAECDEKRSECRGQIAEVNDGCILCFERSETYGTRVSVMKR